MPRIIGMLLAVAWIGGTALAESRAADARRHPAMPAVWPERIEGLGLDSPAARDNAYLQARKEIADYLQRLNPPIKSWFPSESYIRAHLVEREEIGPDLPLEPGIAKRWLLFIKWPELDTFYRLEESKQREAKDEQRRDRMAVFGKMMIGVLIFLSIVATCSRAKGKLRAPCHRKAIA